MTSQASGLAESVGIIDSVDNISVQSGGNAVVGNDSNALARRRRWKMFATNEASDDESKKDRGLLFTCRCKSAVQVSCLITLSSVIELVGNMLALVYGIAYIQSACNFYALDSDPDKKAKEYDEKLERVLFLEKNRVGFVGLLATCLVGLVVSFLMPIGTIYRSWKSLRAAMSLLFSMCLAHIILASIYLSNNELMATLAAIPFRTYEILLIYNHICHYKKKKRRSLKAMDPNGAADSGTDKDNVDLVAGRTDSSSNVDQNKSMDQTENPANEDVKVDFSSQNGDVPEEMQNRDAKVALHADLLRRHNKASKKRRIAHQAMQGKNSFQPNFIFEAEAEPPEYK